MAYNTVRALQAVRHSGVLRIPGQTSGDNAQDFVVDDATKDRLIALGVVSLVSTGSSAPTVIKPLNGLMGKYVNDVLVGVQDSTGADLPMGGGGGGWSQAAFVTAVPFRSNTYMTQQTVGGPVAFTVDAGSSVAGVTSYVRLIADGTNAPTFAGFKEWGGSLGWNNTAGILNEVSFFFDGADYWYSVSQAVGVVPLATVALNSIAVLSNAVNQIVLTYSGPLDAASVPAASAFTISNTGGADTVTAVAVAGSQVTLTKSRATLSADVMTLSYVVPGTSPVKASAGLPAAAIGAQSVANGLAVVPSVVVRLTNMVALTESGDAAAGYTYTTSNAGVSGYNGSSGGASVQSLAAGVDGWFQYKVQADAISTGEYPLLGFKATQVVAGYGTVIDGVYPTLGTYKCVTNGAGGAAPDNTAVAPAANDIVRIERVGNVGYAKISKDNGATFTTIKTWAALSTGVLYATVLWQTPGSSAINIRGGNVA